MERVTWTSSVQLPLLMIPGRIVVPTQCSSLVLNIHPLSLARGGVRTRIGEAGEDLRGGASARIGEAGRRGRRRHGKD